MPESGWFSAVLACEGRRSRSGKTHRKVVVYAYDGPIPPAPEWRARVTHSTMDLYCSRCGFAPRPGDDGMRALIAMAAAQPDHTLFIDGP